MAISIELPAELEASLRRSVNDLDRAATELVLVELYRRGEITHGQLGAVLGFSRIETDAVLKRHDIFYDITAADVARESAELRHLRGGDADRR